MKQGNREGSSRFSDSVLQATDKSRRMERNRRVLGDVKMYKKWKRIREKVGK